MPVNNLLDRGTDRLVKILEYIEGARHARGMTRRDLAKKMNEIMGNDYWSKDRLDDIFSEPSCPRAETLALMLEALGLPTWPYKWMTSKKGRRNEE